MCVCVSEGIYCWTSRAYTRSSIRTWNGKLHLSLNWQVFGWWERPENGVYAELLPLRPLWALQTQRSPISVPFSPSRSLSLYLCFFIYLIIYLFIYVPIHLCPYLSLLSTSLSVSISKSFKLCAWTQGFLGRGLTQTDATPASINLTWHLRVCHFGCLKEI